MARGGKTPKKAPRSGLQPAVPQLIYEANLGANGAVIRLPPSISQAQAVAIRQQDGNVVVCGPNKTANSITARDIEQAASGYWRRCKPHLNAGPNALPHYQPDPRGQTMGHTFYETDTKHPL
jgi:hypothetical protein